MLNPMTRKQITLVKQTFARISDRSPDLALDFYQRLFQRDPRLQVLFHGNLPDQGQALFSMIQLIVRTLDYQEQVVPIVYELGKRHAAYGVGAPDYATFRGALLDTLESALDDGFTSDVRDAWGAAYDFMAAVMEEAHAHVREGKTLPFRKLGPVLEEEADQ